MYETNREFLEDHDFLNDLHVTFLSDEFVNSIIGFDSNINKLIYSYQLMVDDLIDQNNFDEETAIDYLDYNVIRSLPYINNAPVVCMEF